MSLSFIVPAHDEEQFIGRTLVALGAAAQGAGEPYEIIVVDDASSDATSSIAAEHGARVVYVDERQIAAVRNAGAAQALGDLLIFVDADTIVPQVAVAAAVRAMRGGAVGGGATATFDRDVPLYGRGLAWAWRGVQLLIGVAAGCFLFCTRDAFRAVGGFDERLYAAEDYELSRRLKHAGRFVVVKGPVVTSSRTLRAHRSIVAFRILAKFVLCGPMAFTTPQGPWYAR